MADTGAQLMATSSNEKVAIAKPQPVGALGVFTVSPTVEIDSVWEARIEVATEAKHKMNLWKASGYFRKQWVGRYYYL